MSYQKNSWSDGDIITAGKLNNIENGVESIDTNVTQATSDISTLQSRVTALEESSEEGSTPADYQELVDDVSSLKADLSKMQTATADDVGKALKAKTVANCKVTEWEFGKAVGIDETLSISGDAADAKVTGDLFQKAREQINLLLEDYYKRNPEVDLSELPEYWRDNVAGALAHTMILGDEYVHHIVTTDNHYNINYRKSPLIQKLLYDTGMYSKVINVGDITTGGGADEAQNVINDYQYFGNDLILTVGNHDAYGDVSLLYPMIQNNASMLGDKEHFNYYIDDNENKIRYIIINNVQKGSDTSVETNAFDTMPDDYWAIFISHYPLMEYTFVVNGEEHDAVNHTNYGKRLAIRVLGNRKHVICCLCGHEHIDHVEDLYSLGLIKQITFMNDGYYWQFFEKTQGTSDENAVSIFSVNPATKDVSVYRIGQLSLLPRKYSFKYGKTFDDAFYKGLFTDNGGRLYQDNKSLMCLSPKPLYKDNIPVKYYVINTSQYDITDIYETLYTNGVFLQRWNYKKNALDNYNFFKNAKIVRITHGNGIPSGATETIIGVYGDEGITANDLLLASADDSYDYGYGINEIEWIDGLWRKESNVVSSDSLSICSKYITIDSGKTYTFAVNESNWTTNYLNIYALYPDGSFMQTIRRNGASSASITFTIPEGARYIQICGYNIADYKNKISLVLND